MFHGILLYQVSDFLRSYFTASTAVPQSNQRNFTKSATRAGGCEIFSDRTMVPNYMRPEFVHIISI